MISPIAARKAARAVATRQDMVFDSWTLAPATPTADTVKVIYSESLDRAALNGQTIRGILAHARSLGHINTGYYGQRPAVRFIETSPTTYRVDFTLR
jgi:hypothetical protein